MFTVSEIKKLIKENNIAKFYNDRYWRRLSKQIIQEQHGECQYCRAKKKYSPAVLVHHVKELKKYPELAYSRFYIDEHGNSQRQLVALCQNCHEEQHPDRFHFRGRGKFRNEELW